MVLRQGSGVPQCNMVTRKPLATIALCKQTTITTDPALHPSALGAIYWVTGYYLFLIDI